MEKGLGKEIEELLPVLEEMGIGRREGKELWQAFPLDPLERAQQAPGW